MKKELLRILQHSIGVNQYNVGGGRNFYGTSPGCDDYIKCVELVEMRLMKRNGPKHAIFGDEEFFSVTTKGFDVIAIESDEPPEPEKKTRSKARYMEWLRLTTAD